MKGAFRDLHFGIMSTFVNIKIVRFAVIVNKDRNKQTELFYMQVGFQLSWITESGSVAVRCLKEQNFEEYVTHFCMFYLHVLLFPPNVSFLNYPQQCCVTRMFVCVSP